jgi:hypothetical protein
MGRTVGRMLSDECGGRRGGRRVASTRPLQKPQGAGHPGARSFTDTSVEDDGWVWEDWPPWNFLVSTRFCCVVTFDVATGRLSGTWVCFCRYPGLPSRASIGHPCRGLGLVGIGGQQRRASWRSTAGDGASYNGGERMPYGY